MDEASYKGMWYRVTEGGPDRWHFEVMAQPGDRPLEDGEVRGDAKRAAAAARDWIVLLQRAGS